MAGTQSRGAPLQRTVYVGTFLHSASLELVEVRENTAIGVDEDGIIAFVWEFDTENEQGLRDYVQLHGWADYQIHRAPRSNVSFWFPGFIGMSDDYSAYRRSDSSRWQDGN